MKGKTCILFYSTSLRGGNTACACTLSDPLHIHLPSPRQKISFFSPLLLSPPSKSHSQTPLFHFPFSIFRFFARTRPPPPAPQTHTCTYLAGGAPPANAKRATERGMGSASAMDEIFVLNNPARVSVGTGDMYSPARAPLKLLRFGFAQTLPSMPQNRLRHFK